MNGRGINAHKAGKSYTKNASGVLLLWNLLHEEFLDSGKGSFTFVSQVPRGNIVILSLKYLGSIMKDSNKQWLNKNFPTIYCQSKKYSRC